MDKKQNNSTPHVMLSSKHIQNYRPLDFKANLWEIPSDRYLHFPTNLLRKNEYLRFATNVTSDTEDESEEWLKDWLQVKADDAGIRIDDNFGGADVSFRY